MKPSEISVVIPTLNEQGMVGDAIRSAIDSGAGEVIVCDGGSTDATESRAKQAGASKVVRSVPGRGTQLNAGAMFASGEIVLFLHADSRLTAACLQQVADAPDVQWGAYRQRIDSPRAIYRWIEWGNAFRVRWRQLPFGDQAIFVRRSLFKQVGGFPEVPLMEELGLSRRLRSTARPLLLSGPVITSPRRWERRGVIRQTGRNWAIQACHACGVSPESLRRWYQR